MASPRDKISHNKNPPFSIRSRMKRTEGNNFTKNVSNSSRRPVKIKTGKRSFLSAYTINAATNAKIA